MDAINHPRESRIRYAIRHPPQQQVCRITNWFQSDEGLANGEMSRLVHAVTTLRGARWTNSANPGARCSCVMIFSKRRSMRKRAKRGLDIEPDQAAPHAPRRPGRATQMSVRCRPDRHRPSPQPAIPLRRGRDRSALAGTATPHLCGRRVQMRNPGMQPRSVRIRRSKSGPLTRRTPERYPTCFAIRESAPSPNGHGRTREQRLARLGNRRVPLRIGG